MIKYLGSKRSLLPLIQRIALRVPDAKTAVDLFSGTSRVGHSLKSLGFQVFSNDHNAYSATLARCYVEADLECVQCSARKLLHEFQALRGRGGYFTDTFCTRSRFFQPKNGERIDAIREEIARKSLDPVLEAVLLVSLMEAADRVDSTCGVQMAYLKDWAPRSFNDLELRLPDVLPASPHGSCRAFQEDATSIVSELPADIIYLDPPYNQHSYLGNYHIWESLVMWDKPEVYGIACKRVDVKSRKSDFNLKPRFREALTRIVRQVRCRLLVVSFNNEGYIDRADMEALLAERGPVSVLATDYKRYVGAQIGIYNPSGKVVGEVSHLRNVEYLYIVDVARSGVDWSSLARELSTASAAEHVDLPRRRPSRVPSLSLERVANELRHRERASSEELQRATSFNAVVLRTLLRELMVRGNVRTEGERRGTVYIWEQTNGDPTRDIAPWQETTQPSAKRPVQETLF